MLHREDFHIGPISIDQIEPNLYLGSLAAAKDVNTLKKHCITHILTIDICPLPRKIVELKNLSTKFINLSDQPKEDILSHFDEAVDYIAEGIKKGAVLVHCYFGVSRSATLVLAYAMKTYQLSYAEAFEKVKAKRSIIYPNLGFITQLNMYREMGYTISKDNIKYKMFRLNQAADSVKIVKMLPHNFMDLIKPDPGLTQTQPEPNVYRCKKCRRVLATESNLLIHKKDNEPCRLTYFIEPLSWMNAVQTVQGKLLCPKCNSKVGFFSWIMGCQCPCGVQVAPAFYLKPSKTDYSNVVKNVELTF